jgi:hypothetical protein
VPEYKPSIESALPSIVKVEPSVNDFAPFKSVVIVPKDAMFDVAPVSLAAKADKVNITLAE